MASADARRAQLVAATRTFSFGQDTTRLRKRGRGKKPWRAEFGAHDDDKQHAAAAVRHVRSVLRLDTLRLDDIFHAYIDDCEARTAGALPNCQER